MARLTERLDERDLQNYLRAGKPVAGKSDGDGLTFTISKSGRAIWKLRYRFDGRKRWMSLARYPEMSLEEARIRALKERARIVADHVDVVEERRREEQRRKKAKTFRKLAEDYLTRAGRDLAESTRNYPSVGREFGDWE